MVKSQKAFFLIVPFKNCAKSLSTNLSTIQESMTGSNFLPLLEVRQQWKCLFKLSHLYLTQCYGNMGYGVSSGGTNKKDFCLRIKILKGNDWVLRIGWIRRCQNVSIFYFKNYLKLSPFFIEEYPFSNTFFCYWQHQFLNHLFSKMISNFDNH